MAENNWEQQVLMNEPVFAALEGAGEDLSDERHVIHYFYDGDVDGLSAAREIAGERRAAVLILTAFSQRDLIERARDAGALAYLVKPFQKTELLPAIEVALGRFREMKSLHDQATSLEEQLETRKVVDRAKGQLMDQHGLPEAAAFSFIQKTAMRDRETMRSVAQRIIDGTLAPDPS